MKQIKYLLKGKRVQYLWITTQADLERESHPCSSLNYFHGVFLIDFLWPVILNCLVYSPYLVYGSSDSKESAYNAGDLGLIPGSGRSPGEGNGNPFQYSCLEKPMDQGACGLQSTGSQRVGHDWATSLHFTSLHFRLERASQVTQLVKNMPAMWESWVRFLGWEDPWRRAWQPTPVSLPGESPWTEEPGRL